MEREKKCTKCEKVKNLDEFYKNKNKKDGLTCWCKICHKKYQNSEQGKIIADKHRKNNSYRCWARDTLKDHRRKSNKIKTTTDELEIKAKQSTHCNICGSKLNWKRGNGSTTNSPTLDRINNENIISVDSIQILCRACNTKKSSQTMKELVNWCEMVVTKFN
jgi:hypothetical protein